MSAYIYPCPKCGAKAGVWCTERTWRGNYFTTPHIERVYPKEAAND